MHTAPLGHQEQSSSIFSLYEALDPRIPQSQPQTTVHSQPVANKSVRVQGSFHLHLHLACPVESSDLGK